jgi:hypothetical protein
VLDLDAHRTDVELWVEHFARSSPCSEKPATHPPLSGAFVGLSGRKVTLARMPNTKPLKRALTALCYRLGAALAAARSRRYPVRNRTGDRLTSAPAFFMKSRLMAFVVHLLGPLCSLAV